MFVFFPKNRKKKQVIFFPASVYKPITTNTNPDQPQNCQKTDVNSAKSVNFLIHFRSTRSNIKKPLFWWIKVFVFRGKTLQLKQFYLNKFSLWLIRLVFFLCVIDVFFFCFFFSCKSLILLTHSSGKAVFFPGAEKKNGFFTHSLDFPPKNPKPKLIQRKKKRYLW